jgi:hypothetical protein
LLNISLAKVYVVWTGTDSKGAYFTSAAKRFSQFRSFQLEEYKHSLE